MQPVDALARVCVCVCVCVCVYVHVYVCHRCFPVSVLCTLLTLWCAWCVCVCVCVSQMLPGLGSGKQTLGGSLLSAGYSEGGYGSLAVHQQSYNATWAGAGVTMAASYPAAGWSRARVVSCNLRAVLYARYPLNLLPSNLLPSNVPLTCVQGRTTSGTCSCRRRLPMPTRTPHHRKLQDTPHHRNSTIEALYDIAHLFFQMAQNLVLRCVLLPTP